MSTTSRSEGRPGIPASKRIFDLFVLAVLAPVWVPALIVVAVLVWARLGRPVLFRQWRPGRDERPFQLLKFRTMSYARGIDGELLADERRLSAFGRWLRSTSLDELPELLNVLRGEMSLVGPRPLLVQYLPLYSDRHRSRHAVPPGLTGLAQVSGRNALAWPARFELDVQYVEQLSLRRDLQILWKTVTIVMRRDGVAAPGEATMTAFTGYEPVGRSPSADPG